MFTGTRAFLQRHEKWLAFFSLVLVLLITWWPLFQNQFVMWDDDFNIYENVIIKTGTWIDFWTKAYMGFYIPVTYTIWYFIAKLFLQSDPLPFQILNLSFHLLNTCLVFYWLKVLQALFLPKTQGRSLWPIYLVSLLYIVHPLQVGAVAWNSGFRDLLSTAFSLSCLILLFKKRDLDEKPWLSWVAGSVFFALALLSKPASVYLPGMTLLLAFLLERRQRKEVVIWSLVHLGLAGAFIAVTRSIQSRFMIGLDSAPYLDRPFLILDSYGFYIRQFFGGGELSADYGRTPARLMDWGLWIETQPWLWGFLFVVFLASLRSRQWRPLLAFLGLWLVPLSPTSGLVHFNFQRISTVADHYFQPAFPAFCFLFLWALSLEKASKWILRALSTLLIFGCVVGAAQTAHRIGSWKDSETLFQSMLRVNPYSHSANNYLGYFAYRREDWAAAERYFRAASVSQHNSAIATGNLAFAMIKQSKFAEAVQVLERPLQDPDFFRMNEVHRHVIAMNYLANTLALANLGRYKEARDSVCQALKFNPEPRDRQDALQTLSQLQRELNPEKPENESCVGR